MPRFAVGALEHELVHDICMYNRTALHRHIALEKRNVERDRMRMYMNNGGSLSAR